MSYYEAISLKRKGGEAKMKKILIFVLILLLVPTLAFAIPSAHASKTTSGILMLLAGAGLTIDGFQQIKVPKVIQIETQREVEITDPELTLSNVSLNDEGYGYWSVDGMAENTGNCDLEWVKIHVKYYQNGNLVETDYSYLDDYWDCLPTGYSSSWDVFSDVGGSVDDFSYYAEYDYDPVYETITEIGTKTIYKKETKNTLEGGVGIALMFYGIQMLTSDHHSPKPKEVEIKPIIRNRQVQLAMVKRF